jgi:hypothetical protein
VKSDGRHVLKLQSAESSVSVELTASAMQMAGQYRALCLRLEQGWDELEAAEQVRRRAEMDAMLDKLLPQFWQAEDSLLVRRIPGE